MTKVLSQAEQAANNRLKGANQGGRVIRKGVSTPQEQCTECYQLMARGDHDVGKGPRGPAHGSCIRKLGNQRPPPPSHRQPAQATA